MGSTQSQSTSRTPTVAVLGASYGGPRAARLLAEELPKGWRVVLVERNSHMHYLYALARYAALPGHANKAFIPYDKIFSPSVLATPTTAEAEAVFLNASVTSISRNTLTLDKAFPEHGVSESERTLHFDYLIYTLGSHLPPSIDLWGPQPDEAMDNAGVVDIARGTREGGIAWLKKFQERVKPTSSVLVVGGGALGIQYATDIAEIYPTTKVTLIHSRIRLLPRFEEGMHTEVMSAFSTLNVTAILGDRVDLSSLPHHKTGNGRRIVRTESGREIVADLVLLCIGQQPNTELLRKEFAKSIVDEGPNKGMVCVRRTLQLAEPDAATPAQAKGESTEVEEDPATRIVAEHIFVAGDAADAFGAMNAGRNSYFQAELSAKNVLKLIKLRERAESGVSAGDEDLTLGKYVPDPPAIKVTLGLSKIVSQVEGKVSTREQGHPDMDAHLTWQYFGYPVQREDLEKEKDAAKAVGDV